MKNRRISLTLTTTFGMIIVLLLSTAVYFVVFNTGVKTVMLEEIATSNSEIVENASGYLDTKINEQISILKSIEIAHHIIQEGSVLFEDDFYETSLEFSKFLSEIEVVGTDGKIVYSSIEGANRIGVDLSNHELVKLINGPHETYVGSLKYNPDLNGLGLEVIYSGESVHVLGLISIEFFATYGDDFKLSFDNKELMILDRNGIYLYDSFDNQHLIQNRFTQYDELVLNEDITFEINGTESIVSIAEMELNDWKVVVYEDVNSGLRPLTLSMNYFSVTIMVVVIAYFLMFLGFSNVVKREMKTMLEFFDNVSRGYFDKKLASSRYKEFKLLRENFTIMSDKLHTTQKNLEYTAYHDEISGLQTKSKAAVDFEEIRNLGEWEFIYIDIDRFSIINDNYGYKLGDEVIKKFGEYLQEHFNFVYRVEGDEFLVIRPRKMGEDVKVVLRKINKEMEKGAPFKGLDISFSIKAGVSVYPLDANDFYELLQKSMIALRELEKNKTDIFRFYKQEYSDVYERLSRVEFLIMNALDQDEFYIQYQPIVDAKTKKIRGFESLSRWSSEELGFVSPAEFIPVLERTNRIHLLDYKVLEDAILLNKELIDKYNSELVASVNLSVETIMKPDFISRVEKLLIKYQYPPHLLELEITESVFIEDFDAITLKITHLRHLGVKFSEDDFGDAYSSLTYLSRLKIDTLKISRNFLSTLLSSEESKLLVQSILELASGLGLRTIIEGIEEEDTYQLFKKYGCDYIQGYLFYKPMGIEKLEELIKNESEA